jgi:hypothetical protein
MRKHAGDSLRFGDGDIGADKAGHRTIRRTNIALVGAAGMVMVSAMVLCRDLVLLLLMAQRVRTVMNVPVLGQLSFGLYAEAADRAQHAGRKRSPKGKQHRKQQQEPDAKRFHAN